MVRVTQWPFSRTLVWIETDMMGQGLRGTEDEGATRVGTERKQRRQEGRRYALCTVKSSGKKSKQQ